MGHDFLDTVIPYRAKKRAQKVERFPIQVGLRPTLEALERRNYLSLAAPITYNVGTQSYAGGNGFGSHVVTGDFNGDSKLDLAVTSPADGTVNILQGNGNGTFQSAVSYATGIVTPFWMAVADFNGDGKPDIAVEGNAQISVLINNGNGGFLPAVVYSAGTQPRGSLAVGDFFGNGRQDIAVAEYDNGNGVIAILPNNGNGTFGSLDAITLAPAQSPIRSIVAGDFGNGHIDLAVATGQGENNTLNTANPAGLAVYMNNGAGVFTFSGDYAAAVTPDPGGGDGTGDIVNPEAVATADLNHDGKLDLVLSLYDHDVDVFLNTGNGTFGPATPYDTETAASVGGYPRGIAFGDINGDGNVDIISDNFGQPTTEPGSVGVLYGNGKGTFQSSIQYTSPYAYPGGVVVGDFNADGLADVGVTENSTGHSVSVLLNQPNTAQEPPTVTGVTPAAGPVAGGTSLTISGTNFIGTTQVEFGSVKATSFKVNSNTSITAVAPAGSAGTMDVTVYNAGVSATSSADRFTYQGATATLPAPVVIGPGTTATPGPVITTLTPTFTWQAVTGVTFTSYQINLFDNTTQKSVTFYPGITATSFTVPTASALTPGNSYVWNLRLDNGSQTGPPSAYLYFQTPAASTTLPAPVVISPGSTATAGPVITTVTPTFTWQAVTGVTFTSYQINLFDNTTQKFVSFYPGTTATSFTVPAASALTPGDSFVWNLRLDNGSQTGPPSAYLYFQTAPGATISGTVSSGSPGETVYLDANNNSVLDPGELSTTTTTIGAYAFSNVPAGAYIVRQILPAGYTQTTPASGYGIHLTVSAGQTYTNENFADQSTSGGSISGVVTGGAAGEMIYLDTNNNSKLDAGELSTTTSTSGTYIFSNVPVGAYIVRQILPAQYTQTSPADGYGIHLTVAKGDSLANENFTDRYQTMFTQLAGTTIGTAGSYQNDGNTIAKATDGNLSTFFDAPTANGNWVGLDLGSSKSVSQIAYAPRSGFASRMIGGEFQVSTTVDFSSGVTTIYTITAAPATGSLTFITLSSPVTARYVRYLSPNGSYGDTSEFQVFG